MGKGGWVAGGFFGALQLVRIPFLQQDKRSSDSVETEGDGGKSTTLGGEGGALGAIFGGVGGGLQTGLGGIKGAFDSSSSHLANLSSNLPSMKDALPWKGKEEETGESAGESAPNNSRDSHLPARQAVGWVLGNWLD